MKTCQSIASKSSTDLKGQWSAFVVELCAIKSLQKLQRLCTPDTFHIAHLNKLDQRRAIVRDGF